MPQFDPQTFSPQLVWLLMSVCLLLGVVAGYLGPKLSQFILGREQAFEEQAHDADRLLGNARELEAAYEEQIRHACHATEREINQALAELRKDFDAQRDTQRQKQQEQMEAISVDMLKEQGEFASRMHQDIDEMVHLVQSKLSSE